MAFDPSAYLRGFGANVNHFTFNLADEVVPILYLCPTRNCESLAYFVRLMVEVEGHVTCMRCMRPMERASCTVH